ncbi:MAG: hypothetical protein GWN84_26615 [Gammaproteobacteria bacterium]|nr:hypothetical protein [Gammaproteobacteria bacterium]NIR85970.1 hypothetical protein [Gammaproteobacteria bacterium]NIR91961.1 hypothetical protein [Gammaproteobacteria bacterium]NIU07211.1 hypothetical protein [Gammaproteobacteria bacterium]NIV74212.1 hypothetical protein [Gammaproteobacteria bacterium]
MRSKMRNIALVSVLASGLLGAVALQAHPGSGGGMMGGGSMMGEGPGGMMGMMRMMGQMNEMMETCSRMMQEHHGDAAREHGGHAKPAPGAQ